MNFHDETGDVFGKFRAHQPATVREADVSMFYMCYGYVLYVFYIHNMFSTYTM